MGAGIASLYKTGRGSKRTVNRQPYMYAERVEKQNARSQWVTLDLGWGLSPERCELFLKCGTMHM